MMSLSFFSLEYVIPKLSSSSKKLIFIILWTLYAITSYYSRVGLMISQNKKTPPPLCLAHLSFRPCDLLPSLFVRRPSVNISHFNLLLRNYWANCNQTLVEWSLGGPLPKLCPVIPTSNQNGGQAKIRKRGEEIKKKIFSSETTEPISTKLCWNDPWVVPFQNCVRHFRPPTKMAITAKLNLI